MEVKALNILQKDIVEYDDFFLLCEAFIDSKGEPSKITYIRYNIFNE